MNHQPYDRMSPSGVLWLGQVPSHWTLRRLGYFFDERREKVSDKEYPPLSVTKNGIVPQLDTAAKTDDGDNRKRVVRGDFVINSRSDRKGSAGVAELDGSVSLINTVLRPQAEALPRFVHYLLRSSAFQEEFYRYGQGIVADLWTTRYSEMRAILLAMPPLTEQTAIAAFLDRETGKIDALVEEQKRLIELLKEKRQAVISHAVSKGLDPNARMKPSGVEWLGEVPEHWRVTKLGRLWRLQGGYAFPSSSFGDEGLPLVRMNNLNRGSLELAHATMIPIEDKNDSVALRAGDLLWGMSGSVGETGSLGNFARVHENDLPSQLNQRVGRFLPLVEDASLDWLEWVIQGRSFYQQVLLFVTGTAQFNVSSEQVQSCIVALPPPSEMEAIAVHLRSVSGQLAALSSEAERAIALLVERRSALISAAVTGKIDVRDITQEEAA